MKNFKKVKADWIKALIQHSACTREFNRILSAETPSEMLIVVADNMEWCLQKGVTPMEWLEKFDDIDMALAGIYIKTADKITCNANERLIFLGSSAPRIVARGSSAPRIVARESSAPTIVVRESSAVLEVTKKIIHVQKDVWTIQIHETEA